MLIAYLKAGFLVSFPKAGLQLHFLQMQQPSVLAVVPVAFVTPIVYNPHSLLEHYYIMTMHAHNVYMVSALHSMSDGYYLYDQFLYLNFQARNAHAAIHMLCV